MLDAGALETGDVLQYRRDEVPQRVLRRLGRGEYSAQDELDLHHADLAQAEALMRAFLRAARESGAGCVRIIHCTGLPSDSRILPLKNLVDRMLPPTAYLLAYHYEPAPQGRVGAVLCVHGNNGTAAESEKS